VQAVQPGGGAAKGACQRARARLVRRQRPPAAPTRPAFPLLHGPDRSASLPDADACGRGASAGGVQVGDVVERLNGVQMIGACSPPSPLSSSFAPDKCTVSPDAALTTLQARPCEMQCR